jgi:hypothetical protein
LNFALRFFAFGLALSAFPAAASILHISGNFGTSYGGPLNSGSFNGTYSVATLPLIPPDTGTSYEYLSNYDVLMSKGSTLVEFKPGLNSSTGLFSAVYETANGGDYLNFYDSNNDFLILYFAKGFAGVGAVLNTTSKGYISDGGVGGYGGGNISNVISGVASAPEPSSFWLVAGAVALLALGRKRLVVLRLSAFLALLPAIGGASTIFNDLSTGAIPSSIVFNGGYQVQGSGFGQSLMAAEFTPGTSVSLAEFDVAIGFGGPGDGNILLELFNDSAGLPGSQIGSNSWTFSAPADPASGGNLPVSRIAVSGVNLTGGTPYWLVALPGDANTTALWALNDLIPSAQGPHAFKGSGSWTALNAPSNFFDTAFAVIGSDAPEPGSFELLGCGLLAAAFAGWRKRRIIVGEPFWNVSVTPVRYSVAGGMARRESPGARAAHADCVWATAGSGRQPDRI